MIQTDNTTLAVAQALIALRDENKALKAEVERLKSIIKESTKPRTNGIKAAVQTARKEVLFGTDTNVLTNAPDNNVGTMNGEKE